MSVTPGPFQIGTLDVWPDAEALLVSWLRVNLPDVNVRTETDTTFGTPNASTQMRTPLVLVQAVTGGQPLTDSRQTETAMVDLQCFADSRADAWGLYHRAHAWMLRAKAQTTPVGTFDDVWLDNCMGIVNYTNPSLRRVIATYGIATRATATA